MEGENMPQEEVEPQQSASEYAAAELESQMNFPTALHFLHLEWRRFERERSEWELERDELQAKLALLEEERRHADVLKDDLIRRVKMLEYALKQERAKQSGEDIQDSFSLSSEASKKVTSDTDQKPKLSKASSVASRSGRTRELLKSYLREIGMSEEELPSGIPVSPSGLSDLKRKNEADSSRNISKDNSPKIILQNEKNLSDSNSADSSSDSGKHEDIDAPKMNMKTGISKKMLNAWNKMYSDSKRSTIAKKPDSVDLSGLQDIQSDGSSEQGSLSSSTVDPDLADLSLTDLDLNSSDISHDSDGVKSSEKIKLWKPMFVLRGHLDSVRTLVFHPNGTRFLSASEDGTIKFWNLDLVSKMKKPPTEIDPVFSYRGHSGPVTCLALTTMIPPSDADDINEKLQHGLLFSGGHDSIIRSWGLPEPDISPYSSYDLNKYQCDPFVGHSDIIWDLKVHPLRPLLLSASADGSWKIWNYGRLGEEGAELESCMHTKYFNDQEDSNIAPTSIEIIKSDSSKLATSFSNAALQSFDLETQQLIMDFKDSSSTYDGTFQTQINRVISHPTNNLLITAHEDKQIKFFDTRSGQCVNSMVAHLEAVSSLDISPDGTVLASTGHESSIRLWDLRSYSCIQELPAHRKKFGESIFSVAFHPRMSQTAVDQPKLDKDVSGGSRWLATTGADSCIKIYNCHQ